MGIWDKVKGAGKAIKDTAGEGVKAIKETAGEGVKAISDELERRAEVRSMKENLLSNFTLDDMKAFCKQWGWEGPDPYYEDENGRKRKGKLDPSNWRAYCMDFPLDKLKKYAERNGRISQDARNVLIEINKYQREVMATPQEDTITETGPQKTNVTESVSTSQPSKLVSSDFEEILSIIQTKYEDTIRDQEFADEDAFNDNLVSYLRAKFEDKHSIENTRKLHRDTGDIFIDGKYVLELKYADNKTTLDTGLQETKRYKEKNYPGVAVIILDVGALTGSLPQYKRWYEGDGAKVIILRGKGERKKPKKTFIFREK